MSHFAKVDIAQWMYVYNNKPKIVSLLQEEIIWEIKLSYIFTNFLLKHCVRNDYAVHRPIAFCNSWKLYKILSFAKTNNFIKIENNILVLSCFTVDPLTIFRSIICPLCRNFQWHFLVSVTCLQCFILFQTGGMHSTNKQIFPRKLRAMSYYAEASSEWPQVVESWFK